MSNPSPFLNTSISLKAFVLGCDPSAFKDKVQVPLKTVFGIGQDGRYFAGIKANLNQLNIGMDDIYVQNLIPEYRKQESSKDSDWVNIAQQHIPDRIKEFDDIDPTRTIPVFLTSELLYKALLNEGQIPKKPIDIYSNKNDVFIHPAQNKLFRPLIILYRHPAYSLKNQKEYSDRILKYFGF
jgi:hypothetical protein